MTIYGAAVLVVIVFFINSRFLEESFSFFGLKGGHLKRTNTNSMKILGKGFFEKTALKIAPDLLGKYLVRRIGKKTMRFMITDVEIYNGPWDKASHARFGLTKRNAPMFEQGGVWYVYFTYGMHWMLNIVTGRKSYPSAILIRGVEGINGPARITKKLKINKKLNNKIASPKVGLWIENNSKIKSQKSKLQFKIKKLPRVGVNYAGPVWSKKKWRFLTF